VVHLGGHAVRLEAKWLSRPLSADAGTELAGRVRQRLRGTRGIVLSMSGYTKHPAPSAERGQQPEVVLLDRSHFEAMLSGLASPEHLIQSLVRHASRRGGVHLSLTDLLLPERPPAPPTVTSTPDDGTPWNVIHETAGGITARPVLPGDPGWSAPRGLGTGFDRDHLLITTADGIIEVDTTRATTGWALALPGCRGTPLTRPDGSLITLCNYAVVKWHDRMLEIIGGGFTGNSNLLLDADGKSWVFDNTGSQYASLVSLTNLGDRLGEQQGSVALGVGMIEAGLIGEAVDPSSPVATSEVGVRWVPLPTRGDRRRGALVSAVQFVLSRRRGTAGRARR
jgi:hypothetical protein